MFFFVDESGNTGTNLFDENQPILYYGVLCADIDIDVLAEPDMETARKRLSVDRLHASDLGLGKLVEISEHLIAIQEKYQPKFDIYRVAKIDHAVICFFDQVFDQGMNPAMTWTGYWTPLRYVLLVKVASLFDLNLAKRAWNARINLNNPGADEDLVYVCKVLLSRLSTLPDVRSRQLIGDSLRWAIQNTRKLDYNCKSPKEILTVTPNLIGFQTVMHGIALRLEGPNAFASIIVDQQSQFNKEQRNLAEFYASVRDIPWVTGPGLPRMDLSKIPNVPIVFRSSKNSAGIELTDTYLWIFKRVLEGKELPVELFPIVKSQITRGMTNDISINSIAARWLRWLDGLPDPTKEQLQIAKEILEIDEERRIRTDNSS